MNAITKVPATELEDASGSLLNFIAGAMKEPGFDIAMLKELLQMQREVIADMRKVAFFDAMAKAQADMRAVLRNAENTSTSSRYATIDAYDEIIRPVYTRHGFSVMQDTETKGSTVIVYCEVSHGGYSKVVTAEVPFDLTGPRGTQNKTATHAWKSAVTYGRRATLELAFNLTSRNADDDGNAAGRGDTGEVISRAQAAELSALVAQCSADPKATEANERAFLAKMQLGDLRSVQDVRPADFNRLRTALITKRQRLAQAATQGKAA